MRCKLVHLPGLYPLTALLVIFLISLCSGASGQAAFEGFSVNPNVGSYSNYKENQGFTIGAEFSRFKGNTIYSIDYFYLHEFTLFNSVPDDVFSQIGFMAGKYSDRKFFRIEYQGGLAPVFGRINTESVSGVPGTPSYRYYEEDKFFTIGLVATLGFKIIPIRQMSVGVDLQTNLNLKQSLFFPCISLEIGHLKN